MVKRLPKIPPAALYPHPVGNINLNTCGDPDCGNYGVPPNFSQQVFRGRGAGNRRARASVSNPALASGLGRYNVSGPGNDNLYRISSVIEYKSNPRSWDDGRALICQHIRGNAKCAVQGLILSNEFLVEEACRLESMNGVLDGPRCGACGKRYLEAPDEFVFNGSHGGGSKAGPHKTPKGVRVIHGSCRGKPGARFTVSVDHGRQKDRSDNIQILSQIVNGAGINDLRRVLSPENGGKQIGIKRLYDRIFWLEGVLLAYEAAQLKAWRRRLRSAGAKGRRHTRIAHDDIVLNINWETSADRRITALNCSVSADIQSGYVFRIDVDFDPNVDPVAFIDDIFLGKNGKVPALRAQYRQRSGRTFTAPLLAFQRPSGRFDESALFASAELQLNLFAMKTEDAISRVGGTIDPATKAIVRDARIRADIICGLSQSYFNFPSIERDGRNTFTGIMTRDTYTKAASLMCLRGMLPDGKITLVSEQEAAMARVVPHIFRDAILSDQFEWAVIGFDKEATKPEIIRRTAKFKASFKAFRDRHPGMDPWEALHFWTESRLLPSFREDRSGARSVFPGPNFASRAFPPLWIRSPLQVGGETDKSVGFPILSPRYRAGYRALGFQDDITDPVLREAITRRVIQATLQPASTFMNALRERVSFARRAGGRSTRTGGGKYVNGACYNPRVLIALLNIYRVYYNFFELRQYVSPINRHEETEEVAAGTTSIMIPGTSDRIEVPKRRRAAPLKRTPAMRAGIVKVDPTDETPRVPELNKVLYRPWLFYGTPLFGKLEGR